MAPALPGADGKGRVSGTSRGIRSKSRRQPREAVRRLTFRGLASGGWRCLGQLLVDRHRHRPVVESLVALSGGGRRVGSEGAAQAFSMPRGKSCQPRAFRFERTGNGRGHGEHEGRHRLAPEADLQETAHLPAGGAGSAGAVDHRVGLIRISHRRAGHRLGKCLSLASCSAFLGNLQGTDCAGRAWACLGSNTRDDCCRRLRGSGVELPCSMGSRPRLSADAAFAAYWNPGLAPGELF